MKRGNKTSKLWSLTATKRLKNLVAIKEGSDLRCAAKTAERNQQ